jgi:hypothetical protein
MSKSREEREAMTLNLLQYLRTSDEAEGEGDEKKNGIALAHQLWALLASQIGEWLWKAGLPEHILHADMPDRFHLQSLLKWQMAGIMPSHIRGIDPVPVLLPRPLFEKLCNGLAALDKGEVQELFEPTRTGRHGQAWTWDSMRVRALEYVAFLNGQGVVKDIARRRVANAMGIGSIETLKTWEKTGSDLRSNVHSLDYRIDAAKDAGRIEYQGRSDTDESPAVAAREELLEETPEAFGLRYKQMFGVRTHVKE